MLDETISKYSTLKLRDSFGGTEYLSSALSRSKDSATTSKTLTPRSAIAMGAIAPARFTVASVLSAKPSPRGAKGMADLPLAPTQSRLTEEPVERPRTRGDCVEGQRPCPWLSCRHHLAIEVHGDMRRGGGLSSTLSKIGAGRTRVLSDLASHDAFIAWSTAVLDSLDQRDTCSLDVADRGGATTVSVARVLRLTKQRVDQIEQRAKRNAVDALRREGCTDE